MTQEFGAGQRCQVDLVDFRYFFQLKVEPIAEVVARAKHAAELEGTAWTPICHGAHSIIQAASA